MRTNRTSSCVHRIFLQFLQFLQFLESKCAVIKSKCELAIKTVSGIDKLYINQNVDIKQVVDIKTITAKSVEIRNKTKSLSLTKRVCTPKRISFFEAKRSLMLLPSSPKSSVVKKQKRSLFVTDSG